MELNKRENQIVRTYWRLFNRLYPDNIPENDMDGAYYYPDTTALESYCQDTVASAYNLAGGALAELLDQAVHEQQAFIYEAQVGQWEH